MRTAGAVVLLLLPALGQNPPGEQQPEGTKEEFPKFEEVTKDLQKIEGWWTLYRKENRLLAEIPSGHLGKPFLLATSFSRGPYSGWMWDEILVQWERLEKKLLLIQPDVRHRARDDDPLADSVRRNYTETLVTSVDILTMGPQGPVLDLFGLLGRSAGTFLGSGVNGADSSLAKIYKLKNFPSNVELAVDLPGRGGIVTVHYSLSELKTSSYQPRKADDRVGYFLTSVKDYSKSAKEDTRFVRYVNRWNLEKADPKLKLSPPKEPIVFYIEKTVPIRFRNAVREGILEWNKAFEKIGFSEAIVVRQQTADNEFANLDPEDVRYNFFRWITSDRAFAMGPSRVDPRTGQILDADIIFDDSMIRAYIEEHKLFLGEAARGMLSKERREFLKARPSLDPLRHELATEPSRREEVLAEIERREKIGLLDGDGRKACAMGWGVAHQMSLAYLSGLAQPEGEEKWPEEFIHQVVKEIVMHEVGHTLGLRHNFKASSYRPLGEINVENGPPDTSGSVMDYNPLNLSPDPKKQGAYAPRTLGPYDYWAIEYGYKPVEKDEDLDAIAKRVADRGLAYGTDEDVASSDPLINRWDFGSDPLVFAKERMQLVQQIQEKMVDRVVRPGDSYAKARRAFQTLLFERLLAGLFATKYVAGHFVHRDHRGDPNERTPLVPVPVEKQREALAFARDHIFSDQAWRFSPELLNKLGASRWLDWGREFDRTVEFPIHDRILTVQSWILFDLLNPFTLQVLYDSGLRVPADKDHLTIPELIGTLTDSICGEILEGPKAGQKFTERQPFVSSLRRNLQREYIASLINISLETDASSWWPYPRVARTLAWHELKRLRAKIDAVLRGNPAIDRYSQSHLEEVAERIQKALDAHFTRGSSD